MENNIYSFQKWKEFSIEQPDESIYESLKNVLDNTDLNGEIKHSNQNVFKVFSLIITHSYGHLLFELLHFLFYLNTLKIPYYKALVFKSETLKKNIKLKLQKNINNQIEIFINDKIFKISFNRIPVLLVFFDFLEELLGTENLIRLMNELETFNNQMPLKTLSNKISKLIYIHLKEKLPSAYTQSHGNLICNELINFKKEKFDCLNYNDVDDAFIFYFWEKVSKFYNKFAIKTFRVAFELCLKFKKAMEISHLLIQNNPVSIEEDYKLFQQNFYSNEKSKSKCLSKNLEFVADYIVDERSKMQEGIKFFDNLQNQKFNILKKNEIENIRFFSFYPEYLKEIPLSYIRNIIFSNLQNKLIESERRKAFKKTFQNLLANKNEYHYRKYLTKNMDLILNFKKLKSIIFSYLWDNNDKLALELINEYLTLDEKNIVREHTRKLIQNDNQSLSKFSENIVFVIQNNETSRNFNNFKKKLKEFNTHRKSFRRKGFLEENNPELNQILFNASKYISNFIDNIIYFRKNFESYEKLDSQFDNDFKKFTNAFILIHGDN